MAKRHREINIISNEAYKNFMLKLGKPDFLNSWNVFRLTSDNTINILGIIYNVEFVDGDEGSWFQIVSIDDRTIKLKKWDEFHLMLQ